MYSLYSQYSDTTIILISLCIILISGFLVTRVTKLLKLPNVSGFIIAGVLIGPYVLHAVPNGLIENMGFLNDIALAFIAFGVGKFFKKETLKETGAKVITLTIFEALLAGLLVTLMSYFIFGYNLDFSMLLGAIATATAPASTMMTINQYNAKGNFVNTLLQVVALDDVVCLFVFSVVAAIVNANDSGNFSYGAVLLPIFYNLVALIIGFLCGILLSKLITPNRSRDNRLILVVAMLLGISGLCAIVDISPLLSCMVFSAVYRNLSNDKKLYRQINHFTPPIMSAFFIFSGMNLNLYSLKAFGMVGIGYFLVRIIGKYAGAYLGCMVTGMDRNVRNYLGLALIPQAGVAIGLAFLGQRMLPPSIGNLLLTIILSSSVLYELIGPACAKAALRLSGAIKDKDLQVQSGKAGAAGRSESDMEKPDAETRSLKSRILAGPDVDACSLKKRILAGPGQESDSLMKKILAGPELINGSLKKRLLAGPEPKSDSPKKDGESDNVLQEEKEPKKKVKEKDKKKEKKEKKKKKGFQE